MHLNKTQIAWYRVVQEHAQAKKPGHISGIQRTHSSEYFFIMTISSSDFQIRVLVISDPSRENFGRSRNFCRSRFFATGPKIEEISELKVIYLRAPMELDGKPGC